MSSEDDGIRCSKGIKVSNGFVMSGLLIGIVTLSVFGIIIAYYILVYFGIPLNVIYAFIVSVLFAFILITIGVIVYKSKCDEKQSTEDMKKLEEPQEENEVSEDFFS